MSRPRRLWLAHGAPALALAATAAAVTARTTHEPEPVLFAVLFPIVGLSFVGAGLVAWTRRPDNGTGRLLVAVGFVWFLGLLYEVDERWLYSAGVVLGALFLVVFAHLLLAYPSGRLETRFQRALMAVVYPLALSVGLVPALFERRPGSGCKRCPDSAFLITESKTFVDVWNGVTTAAGVLVFVGIGVTLFRRWKRATPAARLQLAPVYVGGAITVVLLGASIGLGSFSGTAGDVVNAAAFLGFGLTPFLFLGGLLRSRLARTGIVRTLLDKPDELRADEIEARLRRVLGDPTLRFLQFLPEGQCVDARGNPCRVPAEDERSVVTPIDYEGRRIAALVHDRSLLQEHALLDEVVATARLALANDRGYQALRQAEARQRALLAALPDLMIRSHRDGTYLEIHGDPSALSRPAADLIGRTIWEVLPEERARSLQECVERTLDTAPGIFVTIDPEGRITRFNTTTERLFGYPADDSMQGRRYWDVFLPEAGQREEAMRILERQQEEVRASRARIVEAADQARRRLERNLHDGAQQRLVSLSLALRLVQARLRTDPDGAAQLLTDAGSELALALALEELRELARGLHPAILSDRGLGPALESLAGRAAIPVELEPVPAERLPGPVEAAAFYVVSESLANVAKYAEALHARVRVARENGHAVVEVSDDGVGGADPARGSGLRGLHDRVEALDGTLELESRPGCGTSVRAVIQLGMS
jgi:signal transduction histidine kinase